MSKTTVRLALGLLALALVTTTAIVRGVAWTSSTARGSVQFAKGDLPHGLAKKMDEAVPVARGQAANEQGAETPDTAAAQAEAANAYPGTDITPAERQSAVAAFTKIKGKGKSRNSTTTWAQLGPSPGAYPAILNRHGSAYDASGRTTAMAISPACNMGHCTLWIGAAGGGIWRTDKALHAHPKWTFVSGPIGSNALGFLYLDSSTGRLWAGTGEAHASGDSEAGQGIWYSDDGGDTWAPNTPDGHGLGYQYFGFRAISSIAIDHSTSPATIYVGTTRAVRGIASVTGGAVSLYPFTPGVGIWKSTDGGSTFTLLNHSPVSLASGTTIATFESSFASPRGVSRVLLDPSDPHTVYASAYAQGIWRSPDSGANWTQILTPLIGSANDRTEFTVTTKDNKTRIYAAEGDHGPFVAPAQPYSRLFRTDDATTASPVFTDLTSSNPADPGYGSYNYCTGQCWYDNFVYTPPGRPDMVYLGGSYQYGESPDQSYNYPGNISNARGVVLSTDAGVSWTDMTEDATSATAPNGLHPDQHVLVTNPNDPNQFFEGSDGGVMRSSGSFSDVSARCSSRGLSGAVLARCQQLLSKVPRTLTNLNDGLNTLQFQSLSVNPANVKNVQGGTQDNGTFETSGNKSGVWPQTIFGDGGQSGFDIANPNFRVHTYFNTTPEVNFNGGDPHDWIFTGDAILEAGAFYIPLITDPTVSGTMYVGANHVWRTKTFGIGTDPISVVNSHCNELTGDFTGYTCGDWVALDGTSLTSPARGDRSVTGGTISSVARAPSNDSTLWAATSVGRLFVSDNANDEPEGSVNFTRIDSLASNDPPRFISSIYVDPNDPHHAWISYAGYNGAAAPPVPGPTPAEANQPGHVFEVTYDSVAGTATFTDRSGDIGDMPINAVVRDDQTGDLYASSDFGVVKSTNNGTNWTVAAGGMPTVEVAGLTIVPGARKLYAASHGMGAWSLTLP
jgi:hypothetical protein